MSEINSYEAIRAAQCLACNPIVLITPAQKLDAAQQNEMRRIVADAKLDAQAGRLIAANEKQLKYCERITAETQAKLEPPYFLK